MAASQTSLWATMLYFAYGSNMCTERLRAPDRVPKARVEGIAKLVEYTFRFHKRSQDGSGKGDAYYTGNPADSVWGVIFEIDPTEKKKLDAAEGLGYGYAEKLVTVVDENGQEYHVVMYVAERSYITSRLQPYSWFKRFVIQGARQHRLPTEYIAFIEAMPAREDPNRNRDAENRAIRSGA